MTRYFKVALVVMLMLAVSFSAHATTNIYKDKYTTEDSSGNWTFEGNVTIQGNTTTSQQTQYMSVTANTPATLTTASSGKVFITDGLTAGPSAQTFCVSYTLPVAANGLVYTFTSGDGSGYVIRSSDSNFTALYTDLIMYGNVPATNTQIRVSQASTGTTVTVYGATSGTQGYWYLDTGINPAVNAETRGVDPKVGG